MGFGASSAYGGPCRMPTADRLADTGLRYSRFHVTSLCSPTRQALMTGRNHHSVGMGVTSEMATSEPGYTGYRPASAATLAQVLGGQRLEHRGVRQVAPDPAGRGQRVRAVHPLADGRGLRRVLRLHGRRDEPLVPPALRRHHAGGAGPAARGRLPPHRGPGGPRRRLGHRAAGADPGQAVPVLPRARRDPRALPRGAGVDRAVRRRVRRRLGRAARADPGPAEAARAGAGGRRARTVGGGGAALGRARPGRAPGGRTVHGDLRRLRRARRPPRGPARRPAPAPRRPRRHAGALPARRQRRLGGGRSRGDDPRAPRRARLRRRRAGDGRGPRPDRRRVDLRHLPGRLGAGDEHPVPVDQAGGLALRRHARRARRALAGRHRGLRRGAAPVPPRHRRAAHRARRLRGARAGDGRRRPAAAGRGHVDALLLRRREGRGPPYDAVLRDGRQPGDLPRRLDRGDPARDALADGRGAAVVRHRRVGALRHPHRLDPGPRPRGAAPAAAGRAAGGVRRRGGQAPGVPARRPGHRAGEPGRRRPGRPAPRPHLAAVRPAGRPADRGGRPERQEPLAHRDRPGRGRRSRRGRPGRPGRPVRRLVALLPRRAALLRLQPPRSHPDHGAGRPGAGARGARAAPRRGVRRGAARRRRGGRAGRGRRRGRSWPRAGHHGLLLQLRRDLQRRRGPWHAGDRRLPARAQRVHRHALRRPGRPRPAGPARRRGPAAGRHRHPRLSPFRPRRPAGSRPAPGPARPAVARRPARRPAAAPRAGAPPTASRTPPRAPGRRRGGDPRTARRTPRPAARAGSPARAAARRGRSARSAVAGGPGPRPAGGAGRADRRGAAGAAPAAADPARRP
ncbi:sulfatase-like hydrolase/transferase [Nocardioides panacis]|uniref:Sulfatase-like hydrolase/transferase n=1 Tax=Nocardioides panacis TaxID=2849501 RepID=A0A975T3W9_9ACTN|nr:sulfatase-like hydrolase/transferase [Nocardioides panacis]